MIPLITDDLMADAIQSDGMVRAGRSYWGQGRVRKLVVDEAVGLITARVQGTERQPYAVSISFLEPKRGGILGDVDCSCPVGIGCKHGAATLFAARALQTAEANTPRLPPGPQAPPARAVATSKATANSPLPLPPALAEWMAKAMAKPTTPTELRYTLTGAPLHAAKVAKSKALPPDSHTLPHRLAIGIWYRSSAAMHKPFIRGYAHTWDHSSDKPAATDIWLLKRMHHYYGDLDSSGAPQGLAGADLVQQIVATGRAHWDTTDGPLLHFGAPQKAALIWQMQADGAQRLTLADKPTDWLLLAQAPPLLINTSTGELRALDIGLPPERAQLLLTLPPVPPHGVAALAARWQDIAGDMTAPPTLGPYDDRGTGKPTPVLSFCEDKVDIYSKARSRYYARTSTKAKMALARVTFDYDGYTVDAATVATQILDKGETGFFQFRRDLDFERAALKQLAQTSLQPLSGFDDAKTKIAQNWDHVVALGAEPADYALVLHHEVPALKAQGWRIGYAPKWSMTIADVDTASFQFDVQSLGTDWFDVALGARIDGKVVDILPWLRQLLAANGPALLEYPDDTLPVRFGTHTALLPMDKLKPVLAMLLTLALQDRTVTGALRLSRHDMATLVEMETATVQNIPWQGAAPLRQLARALTLQDNKPTALPKMFKASLRPYQQQGLDWLQALHSAGFGGVLADDMGLGKTVQALAHLTVLKAAKKLSLPVLIVAPTSVLPNWQAECARFAPKLSLLSWHGSDRHQAKSDIAKPDVPLTSYPLLTRDIDILRQQKYSLAIFDEAQMLKNPKTAGHKAAKLIKAEQVLALSGTPVENQLTDAWSLADLATPGLLGSLDHFTRMVRRPIERDNDALAKAVLARRLKPFLLRRTKEQVAQDLPPKTEIPEWVDMEPAQLTAYESVRLLMQKRVRDEIARVGLMRAHIIFLDALLKLRQICCDPRLLKIDTARKPAPSAKLARLLDMLPALMAEGRRILLFSQFTSMLDLIKPELSALGIPFTEIRGDTKDRKTPVTAFQSGKVPMIVVSLKAGGTGLNLTAADTVILYDPWWNPAVEAQAIDRAHRIGQTKPVFVHRLIVRSSIEEKILGLQSKKRALAATLWGEDGGSAAKLTAADVEFLLGT
jgi:superfamily II DNA or RNA helicase